MSRNIQGLVLLSSLLIGLSNIAAQQVVAGAPNSSSTKAERTVSKEILLERGFRFNDRQRPLCAITGSQGACHVEAFVGPEKNTDESRYTCSKLDHSTYVGDCVNGKLDGFAILVADGSTKGSKEAFLSYFKDGQIAFPALTSYFAGNPNFGVQETDKSYGCVYFGKWDEADERCALFVDIYGSDIFTESNALKLRDGRFDFAKYQLKFLDFVQRKSN